MSDETDRKENALIPAGSTELTTRSSALVRRGLALASQRERVVHFPPDRSMGTLYVSSSGDRIDQKAEARGDVVVPPGMKLSLSVSAEAVVDLSPLRSLRPDDLRGLSFVGNDVADEDLIHVKQLQLLEVLTLGICNRLSDAGLVHVGTLTGLKVLHFSFLNITDSGLFYLTPLAELESLELIQCASISNAGLAHIVALKKLKYLQIDGAPINGTGLSYLHQLPLLNSLHISNSGILDTDVAEHIHGLTNLTSLGLEGSGVSDAAVASLIQLPLLEWLNLERTCITDAALPYLQQLSSLRKLYLSDSEFSHAAVDRLKEALPNCEIEA